MFQPTGTGTAQLVTKLCFSKLKFKVTAQQYCVLQYKIYCIPYTMMYKKNSDQCTVDATVYGVNNTVFTVPCTLDVI